jgi:AcrR family transcriptional regulator
MARQQSPQSRSPKGGRPLRKKDGARGSYAIIGPATRAKIVDAALKCILKHGYHGTTTLLVQKMAGVSRGSLLNQFPTKADLMVAVSQKINSERSKAYAEALVGVKDYYKRFNLMMDIQWELFRRPGGIARLEITVAAISDPELMKRFEPQNRAMDAELRHQTWLAAEKIGITDRKGMDDVVTQSMASLRGLAIDLIYPRLGCDVDAAFALIKKTHMEAVDRLIAASKETVGSGRSRSPVKLI